MSAIFESPLATTTATENQTETAAASELAPTLYKFTVDAYHKMIEAGVFAETERIELIKGMLVKMSPKGKRHAAVTDRLTKAFYKLLGERVIVRNQNPILFNNATEPEPDIALLAPQEQEYFDRLPAPSDVLLIVEVSDTTLKYDREQKSLLYAHAGIKHYLILNLNTREIIDLRDPSADGYRNLKTLRADERFNLVAFPEIELAVSDLLPPQ